MAKPIPVSQLPDGRIKMSDGSYVSSISKLDPADQEALKPYKPAAVSSRDLEKPETASNNPPAVQENKPPMSTAQIMSKMPKSTQPSQGETPVTAAPVVPPTAPQTSENSNPFLQKTDIFRNPFENKNQFGQIAPNPVTNKAESMRQNLVESTGPLTVEKFGGQEGAKKALENVKNYEEYESTQKQKETQPGLNIPQIDTNILGANKAYGNQQDFRPAKKTDDMSDDEFSALVDVLEKKGLSGSDIDDFLARSDAGEEVSLSSYQKQEQQPTAQAQEEGGLLSQLGNLDLLGAAGTLASPILSGPQQLVKGGMALTDKAVIGGLNKLFGTDVQTQGMKSNVADDLFNVASGTIGSAGAAFAPATSVLGGAALSSAQDIPGVSSLVSGAGQLMQGFGGLVNQIPGLSNIRESLSDENKQQFDMLTAAAIPAAIGLGTQKGRNILGKVESGSKTALTDPLLAAQNVGKTIQELPDEVLKARLKMSGLDKDISGVIGKTLEELKDLLSQNRASMRNEAGSLSAPSQQIKEAIVKGNEYVRKGFKETDDQLKNLFDSKYEGGRLGSATLPDVMDNVTDNIRKAVKPDGVDIDFSFSKSKEGVDRIVIKASEGEVSRQRFDDLKTVESALNKAGYAQAMNNPTLENLYNLQRKLGEVINENTGNKAVMDIVAPLKSEIRQSIVQGADQVSPGSNLSKILDKRFELFQTKEMIKDLGTFKDGELKTSDQKLKSMKTGTAGGSSLGTSADKLKKLTEGKIDLRESANLATAIQKATKDVRADSLLENTTPFKGGIMETGASLLRNLFSNPEGTLMKFSKLSPEKQKRLLEKLKQ